MEPTHEMWGQCPIPPGQQPVDARVVELNAAPSSAHVSTGSNATSSWH